MKAIGFAYGHLYGCRAGPYSVVVAAPDRKTATEAFESFLKVQKYELGSTNMSIKITKQIGARPLLWAQVDVADV